MDEEVAAFRAAHASASAAIEDCDRPTWALQLAFDEASDKKAVIACGVLAAQQLLPSTTVRQVLSPFPTALDVVERWAGKGRDKATKAMGEYKAFAIAIAIVAVVVMVSRTLVLDSWLRASDTNKIILTVGALVAIYVVAALIKRWLARSTERRVGELDEKQALAIVLEQLSTLGANNPGAVPRVTSRLRTSLALLLDGKA